MNPILIHEGEGRTRVSLSANYIGKDLIMCIFNDAGHLGAVAIAEYSNKDDRSSASVITRFGHKDDIIAVTTARTMSKALKQPVCAIAGIHLDAITSDEIIRIMENCDKLTRSCMLLLTADDGSAPA